LTTAGAPSQGGFANPIHNRMRQAVCVPPGGAQVCLRWRYLSAEVAGGAGGCPVADSLAVAVTPASGATKLPLLVNPKGMCDPAVCATCGGSTAVQQAAPLAIGAASDPNAALAADWGWTKSCFDLGAWAGQRIELRVQLANTPGLDSAALIDAVDGW
ncbi:MAG: hypothetical protein FJ100_23590, partial [Deltaproteobacteria bacterium]|nr:hypothetical protein [Deltaproteobacteria bacterium]